MSQAPRPPAKPVPSKAGSSQLNLTLLLVSLGLGLAAVVAHLVTVDAASKSAVEKTVTVYQTRRALEAGDTVEAKDLRTTPCPVRFIDTFPGAITTEKELSTLVLNRRVRRDVAENAIITSEDFIAGGGGSDSLIGKGKRLATLPVDKDFVSGLIRPESRVDISVAITPRNGQLTVLPVMEGVRVVGVGDRTKNSPDTRSSRSYNKISIEVTAAQSQTLATIMRYLPDEEFIFTLRAPGDTDRTIIGGGINPEVLKALGIGNE